MQSFGFTNVNTISDSLVIKASQFESDSASINFLLDSAWDYMIKNNRVTEELLKQVEAINKDKEIPIYDDVVLYYRGVLNRKLGNFHLSKDYYQEYLSLAKASNNSEKSASVHLALANLFHEHGFLDSSMIYTQHAIQLYKSLDKKTYYCRSVRKIASLLRDVGRSEESVDYLRNLQSYATEHNLKSELANIHNDLGISYEKMNMPDSMFHYYLRYHDYATEANDKIELLYSNYNLGMACKKIENYSSAMSYLNASHKLALETNDLVMLRFTNLALAETYSQSAHPDMCLNILTKMELEDLSIEQKAHYFKVASQAFSSINDFQSAFESHEKYKMFSDSVINSEMNAKVATLETEFQNKEKTREIDLLNSENSLMTLALEKAAQQKLYFLIGILALSIIIFLLLKSMRLANRNQVMLNEKNKVIEASLLEKKNLLQEIHHRVKNNLQIVSSLLSLQGRQIDNPIAFEAIKESRNRVKSMALIHQNLYEDDQLINVDISEYIDKLANSLFYNYNVQGKDVRLETDIDDLSFSIDEIIPIGLILNELITNALKYAFNEKNEGLLSIKLKEISNIILLEVKDNGRGLPESFNIDASESLGFKLINSFAKKLNASFEINRLPYGTLVRIKIPKLNAA